MKLTKNFSREEFACKCGECGGLTEMDEVFLNRLQDARDVAGHPFKITSGYRCPAHEESVKRPTSSHTTGRAVDISTPDSRTKHSVVRSLIRAGLNLIGVGENFVHVDGDMSKAANVLWTY